MLNLLISWVRSKFTMTSNRGTCILVGRNTTISPTAILDTSKGGSIIIGDNCTILHGVIIASYGGTIVIGSNCSVNPYCILYGHGGLRIENSVRIAAHSVIIPANHIFSDRSIPIYKQGIDAKGIIIEEDVWVGAGVRILDGVTVGKGSIIAAGAVITKCVEQFGIYAGVPARKIGQR